jgi:SulP family sulfate permease
LYLNRTSKPGVEEVRPLPGSETTVFVPGVAEGIDPRLKIVRLNGSIFFGAVDHLQESLQSIDEQDPSKVHLLLVASGINFVDLAGAQLLGLEALRRRALGGGLYLFNVKEEPLGMLRRSGQLDVIGPENLFALGDDVIGQLAARLGRAGGTAARAGAGKPVADRRTLGPGPAGSPCDDAG